MKTKNKIEKINCQDFVRQYLSACGIEDVGKYLKPSRRCFDKPSSYENMKEAIKLFDKHIKQGKKIGIVMD